MMNAFGRYSDSLQHTAGLLANMKCEEASKLVREALLTDVRTELRSAVKLADLRGSGAFFTGTDLSQRAAGWLNNLSHATVLDPACGAGDLLIACARDMEAERSWQGTVDSWTERLLGYDLQPEFIRAARLRLTLNAWDATWKKTGSDPGLLKRRNVFAGIRVASGADSKGERHTHNALILNPPFTHSIAPKSCEWAKGKVSTAALFLESWIIGSDAGTPIVAILPDVLRSGSRYKRFREFVERTCEIVRLEIAGKFDSKTDVDVFMIMLRVRNTKAVIHTHCSLWQATPSKALGTLDLQFDITVGPVVDFRDPKEGRWQTYARPRDLTPWTTVTQITRHRRYKGRLIKGPFVSIRRTSSPSDRWRATGNIINCAEDVAVENHLIIAKPRSGGLKACQGLLKTLQTKEMNDWLNGQIRCRHLTVQVIKRLPWGQP